MTEAAAIKEKPRVRVKAISQSYTGASFQDREIALWRPPLSSADGNTLWDADTLKARARDLGRNNPYADNAVRIRRASVIGRGLRLSLKPDHVTLGISFEAASEWANAVERRWELYANSPARHADARRLQTFNELLQTAEACFYLDGEALGALEWKRSPNSPFRTCLHLIDADRLENPNGAPDGQKLRGGIERDAYGEPVAYHIRNRHRGDGLIGAVSDGWARVRRQTAWGRPLILHYYDHHRPDLTRGVTRFASVLRPMKMLAAYDDIELSRAMIQASYAAVIKTQLDYEKAATVMGADALTGFGDNPLVGASLGYMSTIAEFHREAGLTFNGARIPHLLPNEDLEVIQSNAPNSNFADYENAFLRKFSAGLGVDFCELAKNYSEVNYSSLRGAHADIWRHYMCARQAMADGFAWPFFGAWLEEAIDIGELSLPAGVTDFYAAKDALCRGRWIGWGKPLIDPLKERKAQEVGLNLGVETLESICAEQGQDWEEVVEQRARERDRMAALGLSPATLNDDPQAEEDPDAEDIAARR
jgi:lambda family phage portal protein